MTEPFRARKALRERIAAAKRKNLVSRYPQSTYEHRTRSGSASLTKVRHRQAEGTDNNQHQQTDSGKLIPSQPEGKIAEISRSEKQKRQTVRLR